MAHLAHPRFTATRRKLSAPLEHALLWRGVLSIGGLYAQLGATVPSRAFELAYSPGFRNAVVGATPTNSTSPTNPNSLHSNELRTP
jgi:hypothetical protein